MIFSCCFVGYLWFFIDLVWVLYLLFLIWNECCCECVLLIGVVYIVIWFDVELLWLFDCVEDDIGCMVGVVVVGGVWVYVYFKDVFVLVLIVGVLICLGVVWFVIGVLVLVFYGLYLLFDDLWGVDVVSICDWFGEVVFVVVWLDLWEMLLSVWLLCVIGIDLVIVVLIV